MDANGSFLWSEKSHTIIRMPLMQRPRPDGGFTVGCEMEEFYVLVIKVAADGMVGMVYHNTPVLYSLHTTGITRTADGGMLFQVGPI